MTVPKYEVGVWWDIAVVKLRYRLDSIGFDGRTNGSNVGSNDHGPRGGTGNALIASGIARVLNRLCVVSCWILQRKYDDLC